MSEVFYFNAKAELQKLELYNVNTSEFIKRNNRSGFKILCVLENGKIVTSSPEFISIETEIADSLLGILC